MEIAAIERAIRADKPVLGVCLGAQLTAAALGANVSRNPSREIGWYDVRPTAAAQRDPRPGTGGWSSSQKGSYGPNLARDAFILPIRKEAEMAPTEEQNSTSQDMPNTPKREKTKPKSWRLTADEIAMLERMGGEPEDSAGHDQADPKNLSAAQLSSVVASRRKGLQQCYEEALRGVDAEDPRGAREFRIEAEFTISPNGNVTSAEVSDADLPGMKECIHSTIKLWKFPNALESTSTRVPFIFEPSTE